MKQMTLEWLQEKIGALYVANMQMAEEIQVLTKEIENLKKVPEGSILDE